MKKETLAEKLAKKSFESTAVQKSWQEHMKAFGPILEPAFTDDYQAKVDLTAALNHISRRDIVKGLKKLQAVETHCVTDADYAAWLFFSGLCMEMANRKEEMLSFYQQAGEYGHRFYLPYLQIAKAAHNDAAFDIAKDNYLKTVRCLENDDLDDRNRVMIGSVYTNLVSCLTMMHCYDEAEEALRKSMEILPEQPGRTATEAILAAAEGDKERAYCCTDTIARQLPPFYETTKQMVDEILEGRHPQFSRIPIEKEQIDAFWDWFVSNEDFLLNMLKIKEYDAVFQLVQPKLKELFPFMKRDLDFSIEPEEGTYKIAFADYHMTSLENGYKELIDAKPERLSEHWEFDISR